MKAKLLRKLRKEGRDQVHVHSITRSGDTITGMSYWCSEDKYCGLFKFGDTEEQVLRKATVIYINDYIKIKRNRPL